MTDEKIDHAVLVAEARRLGQGDWCLSVPNVAKAVLNQLADALEAAQQDIDLWKKRCAEETIAWVNAMGRADAAVQVPREPQPGDGPDFHAEHAAWRNRTSPDSGEGDRG